MIIGCAMPEAEQGMNVARIASLRAGLPIESAAMTINRYCASGLQSIALAAERIRGGGAEVIVAGGTESMSFVPMGGNKISINPRLMEQYPDSYLSMGLTAERVAQHYGISARGGRRVRVRQPPEGAGGAGRGQVRAGDRARAGDLHRARREVQAEETEIEFKVDEGPRADTSLEALAKLKPAFHAKGTVTAGNSSQTSDGAAAAVVMSAERAQRSGICSRWRGSWRSPMPDACRRRWGSARCTRFRRR